MAGERVVLGDLLELVGGQREGRQLHAVDRALLHGEVHLDVGHRHRVRAHRLHHRHVGGRLLHPDRLPLHVFRNHDGALVRHHVAEAPAAAEAEGLQVLGLHLLEQLLAQRPVHHRPHLLAGGPEEGQVEGLVGGLEHAAHRRAADRGHVDGAELHAFEMRALALGQCVGDVHVHLDLPPASLGQLLGEDPHRVVQRIAAGGRGARLPRHGGLRGGDGRRAQDGGEAEGDDENQATMHGRFSSESVGHGKGKQGRHRKPPLCNMPGRGGSRRGDPARARTNPPREDTR